jgi:hypothetical protein
MRIRRASKSTRQERRRWRGGGARAERSSESVGDCSHICFIFITAEQLE